MLKRGLLTAFLLTLLLVSFIPAQAKQNSRRLMRRDTLMLKKGVVVLRSRLVQRKGKVAMRIPLYHRPAKGVPGKMLKLAFAPTAKGREGDYLYWSVSSCALKYSLAKRQHGWIMSLTYYPKYRTSDKQEEKITKALNKAKKSWAKDNMTEKLRKINTFICENLEYDKKISDRSYNVYHALHRKGGVCLVYSMLYYRLAVDAGIPCRIITGAIEDKKGHQTPHCWNAVKYRGKFYHTDLTYYDSSGKSKYLFKTWRKFYDKRLIQKKFSNFCICIINDPPRVYSEI